MGVFIRCIVLCGFLLGCGRSELGAAESMGGGTGVEAPSAASGGRFASTGGSTASTGGAAAGCDLPCGQCPGDGELIHEGPVLVGSSVSPVPTPPEELRRMREIHGLLAVRLQPGDEASAAALGCLERVEGRVNIELSSSAVRDLSWLSSLTEVTDAFVVRSPRPEDLMPGAHSVSGLRSLAGLENLRAVGHLAIVDLPELESLFGLENLLVSGMVRLSRNPRLTDISGLDGLVAVNGKLEVVDNPVLPWCKLQALSVRVGRACECIEPELSDGRACSCVDGCKCTGNDNNSPVCE